MNSNSREHFRQIALQYNRDEELVEKLENYISHLEQRNIPVIFSGNHLALILGYGHEQLKALLDFRDTFYRRIILKKKRDGYRHLLAPKSPLISMHYWIKENILDTISFPDYITAYQKNKSIINNAEIHSGSEIVIKFDIKNFYDQITLPKVYKVFRYLGYGKSISIDLAKLCTFPTDKGENILPQGSPTSPSISNMVCIELDRRLYNYALKNEFKYSRYSDDITFSGPKDKKLKKNTISKIIRACGFEINEQKTKYIGKGNRQTVTGLNVNNGVTISKIRRKTIETHLHNCVRFGPYNHLAKIGMSHKTNYREWLLGNIYFIMSVHPDQGKKMKAKFDKINWIV